MQIHRSKTFTAERSWGAIDIAVMNGISTRLHWTDQPYRWHVNDGQEVFAVMDGQVEMRYREGGVEQSVMLETGDIFYASVGTEHVAHPVGQARILGWSSKAASRPPTAVPAACGSGEHRTIFGDDPAQLRQHLAFGQVGRPRRAQLEVGLVDDGLPAAAPFQSQFHAQRADRLVLG